ncbi:hypothetical protein [Photobacterium halotolerans]|uniref:Uncharacterized protein n=1 Tax=Photobacterium halotolerans TaxID=265726 RepID=A0A0F5VB05_9GAMM|nr:hypothetical protein [Photobacterium halotolerans]KKC98961.1 hypothetical protein KY46_15265 [Photobacterium halotolerans]
MLKLVSSTPDVPTEQIANHIADYAPALAISMLGTINGDTSYDSLKKTCTEHLHDWWMLSIPSGTPDNTYESVYWYLLHLMESLEEHQLLGNCFIQFRVTAGAKFLLGMGEAPDKMQGIRP